MHSSSTVLSTFLLAFFSVLSTTSQFSPCSEAFLNMEAFLEMRKERNTTNCKKLTTLKAEFAWNYHIVNARQTEIEMLLGTTTITDEGWLAWGVNPEVPKMVGTRAIIGILLPNGTFAVDTYNITEDTKSGCRLQPSDIDVGVQNMTSMYHVLTGYFTISARLILPAKYDISSLNHVWQVGHDAESMEPGMHPTTLQNVDSVEILNLTDGRSQSTIGLHQQYLRKVHGILNIVGWGTLLPIGVIFARYFRKFPFQCEKWWFKIHVSFQTISYTIGTIGWAIGLWLGQSSRYYSFHTHRILGICIFAFTTLQLLAFQLRPMPTDEYRKHWNVYHHFFGYALIGLTSVNIFQGIAILKPSHGTWEWAYIVLLVVLATVTLGLEICTWIKFLLLKTRTKGQLMNKGTPES